MTVGEQAYSHPKPVPCVSCAMDPFAKAQPVPLSQIQNLLTDWEDEGYILEGDPEKHQVLATDGSRRHFFRLPLTWPEPARGPFDSIWYLSALPDDDGPYLVMLVQLGAAAIGVWMEGEWQAHKAIKKYMKRHKRGKAQISYLNTRGKSKAGSRIRLANTVAFFEEINERLTDWEELYEPQRILYSCPPQAWGLLFQSKTPPPFDKKDPRLVRIPHQVHVPDFAELNRIQGLISQGWVSNPM